MRQPSRYQLIADRRAIIDRRALSEQLGALPDKNLQTEAGKLLRAGLDAGRDEIARRLTAEPGRGRVIRRFLLLPCGPDRPGGL
jgi:[protein-PII] uridylyltransferase